MVDGPTYEDLEKRIKELEAETSKHVETEKALRESEERLELVLEATSEGIWDWDIANGKIYASKRCSEIFGVTTDTGIPGVSESWTSRIHPEDYDYVSRCLEEHLMGKGSFDVVYRHRHENGEYRWQLARGMALFDDSGNPYRMVGAIQDISEKKLAEEEKTKLEAKLLQAQKIEALGTLANGIAHDFNNLLTSILGNIELSHLYANDEDRVKNNLDKAKLACGRAKDLTRQVITFAKGVDPIKRTASLAKLIQHSSILASTDKGVKCEFFIPDDLWPVDHDVEQMRLVITNLIINASEAMGEKGIIRIRAENIHPSPEDPDASSRHKQVRISIQDQGKGIDQETLAKIFDPYYSSKGLSTQKGMGLGLSICYSIIGRHNGHIEVESEMDKGTTFHIYLPASGD